MTMNFGQHDSRSGRHDFGRDDFRATWPVTGIGPLSVELAVKGLKLFSEWIIRFHLNLVWGGKLLTSAVIVSPSPCDVMYIFNSPYLKYIWNKSKPIASACTIAGKERDIQLVVAPLSRQTLFATGSSTSQIFWKEYNSLLKLLSIFLPSYEPSIWFFFGLSVFFLSLLSCWSICCFNVPFLLLFQISLLRSPVRVFLSTENSDKKGIHTCYS